MYPRSAVHELIENGGRDVQLAQVTRPATTRDLYHLRRYTLKTRKFHEIRGCFSPWFAHCHGKGPAFFSVTFKGALDSFSHSPKQRLECSDLTYCRTYQMDNPDAVQYELQSISDELKDLIEIASDYGFKATSEHKERFQALKDRIRAGANTGKLAVNSGPMTESEELIYQPTLRNAERYFTVRSNASAERWLDVLLDVQCSIDTSLTANQPAL